VISIFRRSAHRSSQSRRGLRQTAAAGMAVLTTGLLLFSGGTASASPKLEPQAVHVAATSGSCGSLTVMTDATRLPAVQDYEKAHPCVKVTTTLFGYTGSTLQTKIGLFNREGSGWPELMWDPGTPDAGWLDSPTYHYAAVLNHGLVPQSEINQWALNSLNVCTSNGNIYCLRNDIAANVLWYNAPLMKKFGYAIPTTWQQYAQIGQEVAKQHPGYVIGTIGDTYADAVYFWGTGCPTNELTGNMKIEINMTAAPCKQIASLLDPLIKDGSISTLAVISPAYVKKYGVTDKTLMMVGATWYGQYIFSASFKPAKGTWGAALPLTLGKFHDTGDIGGGIWEVSSHSSSATQKLAAQAAYWLDTAPAYQKTAPTYPANTQAANLWVKTINSSGIFANSNIGSVFKTASNEIWPGYNFPLFNPEPIWASTVVPALVGGKSMSAEMSAWQTALSNQAKAFGYQVVNS
jgi:ABC-type glycerol-3-phosphate transport system substrate-binding protein